MPRDSFLQRKTAVLSKLDKSSIGGWDEPIVSLCNKINGFDDFYTTSSCSGRIIVMVDQDKKGKGLFQFVSHDLVGFEDLWGKIQDLLDKSNLKNKYLKFKSEPPIIHICCRTLEGAKDVLEKAQSSGWKRSGVINLGKNILVELICTDKLEFPLIRENKLLVDENFLKIILEKSNFNLKKGWKKIEKLEKIFK